MSGWLRTQIVSQFQKLSKLTTTKCLQCIHNQVSAAAVQNLILEFFRFFLVIFVFKLSILLFRYFGQLSIHIAPKHADGLEASAENLNFLKYSNIFMIYVLKGSIKSAKKSVRRRDVRSENLSFYPVPRQIFSGKPNSP